MIQIRLNGELKTISPQLKLIQLLHELQLDPQKVAVAKNLEVVPRSQLNFMTMQPGDQIEIFHAVGGG